MNNPRPSLETLTRGSTVRHLLIEGDDNAEKTLSKLENSVRTVVDTGTHFEMDQKEMTLIQEWCKKEDFRWRKDNAPVWESLSEVIALAKLMGHTSLSEATHLATIPLDGWQGCRDKYGDDYAYWYTIATIEARPMVTAKHGVGGTPPEEELFEWMRNVIAIRNSLGPDRRFFLD